MNKQAVSTFLFNETQRIPTLHGVSSSNDELLKKIIDLDSVFKHNYCKQHTEINLIKHNQKTFDERLNKLFQVCETIVQTVTEVKDKLSQYDIDDVDEVSDDGEVEGEVGDDSDNAETEQQPDDYVNDVVDDSVKKVKSKSGKDHPMSMGDIDYTGGLAIAETYTTANYDDAKEHVKPKRKYNRRKK